jgi:hypothetical protein
MRRLLLACLLASPAVSALALPTVAHAESEEVESAPLSAAPVEEKKGPAFNEVEHGFYVGVETGAQITLPGFGGSMATGQAGGIELGYEPLPLLSIGALVWAGNANTSSLYTGDTTVNTSGVRGNFSTLLIGANARLNLSLGADAYDVRRVFFYIRGGAGYALVRPTGLLGNGLAVFGGPGIEYFTHLRHFSVGFEVDANYGLTSKALGIVVQPVVRYSF